MPLVPLVPLVLVPLVLVPLVAGGAGAGAAMMMVDDGLWLSAVQLSERRETTARRRRASRNSRPHLSVALLDAPLQPFCIVQLIVSVSMSGSPRARWQDAAARCLMLAPQHCACDRVLWLGLSRPRCSQNLAPASTVRTAALHQLRRRTHAHVRTVVAPRRTGRLVERHIDPPPQLLLKLHLCARGGAIHY